MYRIYFEDKTTYLGDIPRFVGNKNNVDTYEEYIAIPERGKFEAPPFKPVVAILQLPKDGIIELLSNSEYYLWRNQHWVAADLWHVFYYLQEFGVLEYRGSKKRVKQRKTGKWRDVNSLEFYSILEDTGLVLLGTVETAERNAEVFAQIMEDMERENFPPLVESKIGLRLTGAERRNL